MRDGAGCAEWMGRGEASAEWLYKLYLTSMSNLTYTPIKDWRLGKPLAWLHGEITTPPFSQEAKIEAGFLLRRLQQGETLSMPQSRPMPNVGRRCHELRVRDEEVTWRIVYRIDSDAIVILEVFAHKSSTTPHEVVETCKRRLVAYDRL